jgi:predicted glycosyltransferase involved in capsule biosynthesis
MITLTDTEAALLVELLELASDSFGNHGCSDFDLEKSVPSLEDRRALMKAYHEYNGDPEEFMEEEEFGTFRWFKDYALMGYLADRVKGQLE